MGYVPKSVREPVRSAFSKVKSHIMGLYNGVKEKLNLKDEVEEQARREHNEENVEGVIPVEHKKALNGAYKSFRIDGQKKADIDSLHSTSNTSGS